MIFKRCWELYEEPIDWNYIIKNKCPCWFWDDKEEKRLGILVKIDYSTKDFPFKFFGIASYKNCRPVRRDEVTFYEDRKDE